MFESFYLHTLGCKVNAYETSALGEELSRHGLRKVQNPEEADVIVLNTCSVTARADQKSRQHISSFRRRNPNASILVMGCYSQTHAEECVSLGANVVLGSSNRSKAFGLLEESLRKNEPIIDVKPSVRNESYEELGFNAYSDNARAYLKVQDGCNNFCSYCYIPTLRGNSRSREPREVVEEAIALENKGFHEIIITGIHIGAYGEDLDGHFRLADLLNAILNKCEKLDRLRISSIEESEIDDGFLSLLRNRKQVVDHLHIPLQSGSSDVLKAMHRHYDTKAFLEKLSAIRSIRPEIAITTDIIVGFPSETEEDFAKTLDFCKEAKFAEIHVFPFSPRPNTPAYYMKDLSPQIKKERVKRLMDLSKSLRKEYESQFYGRSMPVLFEDYDEKKHLAYGHTENYLLVAVPSDKPRHGEIAEIIYDDKVASD